MRIKMLNKAMNVNRPRSINHREVMLRELVRGRCGEEIAQEGPAWQAGRQKVYSKRLQHIKQCNCSLHLDSTVVVVEQYRRTQAVNSWLDLERITADIRSGLINFDGSYLSLPCPPFSKAS